MDNSNVVFKKEKAIQNKNLIDCFYFTELSRAPNKMGN